MKELRNKYKAIKHQAIELMKGGNVNAYLAKLKEVDDLKTVFKFITENNGGEGAVREICDLIFFQKKNE